MSFKDQAMAFFDELSNITDAQARERDETMANREERPFSNLLTQDEEPMDYRPQGAVESEPTVVTRAGGS